MPDNHLRKIFRQHIPEAMWTAIETGSTAAGVPDAEFIFPSGVSGWIEFKATDSQRMKRSKSVPFQIAWHEVRRKMGGHTFVAVRQEDDILWLFTGRFFRLLANERLDNVPCLGKWLDGPKNWDWKMVSGLLQYRG